MNPQVDQPHGAQGDPPGGETRLRSTAGGDARSWCCSVMKHVMVLLLLFAACRPAVTAAQACREIGGHPMTECRMVREDVARGPVMGVDVFDRCVDWCLDGSAGSDDAPANATHPHR